MKRIGTTIISLVILATLASCSDKTTQTDTFSSVSPSIKVTSSSKPTALPSPVASAMVSPTVKPTVIPSGNEATDLPINSNVIGECNRFSLDVTLDANKHKLKVKQNLDYVNKTGKNLEDIYFNLIPEAFTKNNGGTKMSKVVVDGKQCKMKQVKETVYKIDLPNALPNGKRLQIDMDYVVSIPNIANRFGYHKDVYNLGNFIVTPAVYEKDGWSVQPYVEVGDAFYTETADYSVKINVPKGYIVAATGTDNGKGSYIASAVRDFAFCASSSYKVLTGNYDGGQIDVFYSSKTKKTAQRALDAAKNSLELYNKTLGNYYKGKYSVVFTELGPSAGGMEYPRLIMISSFFTFDHIKDSLLKQKNNPEVEAAKREVDRVICHETAHQWFYSLVGNDQISDPWLDEGFCEFSEYLYQKAYPPEYIDPMYPLTVDRFKNVYQIISQDNNEEEEYFDKVALLESIYYYKDKDVYEYAGIYTKGASLLYMMEEKMGEEAFSQALKEYVSKYSYGLVTPENFKEFWNGKTDFSDLFKLYFK